MKWNIHNNYERLTEMSGREQATAAFEANGNARLFVCLVDCLVDCFTNHTFYFKVIGEDSNQQHRSVPFSQYVYRLHLLNRQKGVTFVE